MNNITETTLTYSHDSTSCEAFIAYPKTDTPQTFPIILIAHDWGGRGSFTIDMAKKMAEKGFVGYALDMYGNAKLGSTKEEKEAMMNKVIANRKFLQERIVAAYNSAKTLDYVDNNRILAIGFCFGGLCVLDLARSGVNVKGVASFHGFLHGDNTLEDKPIKAKILAFHGYKDPMVSQDNIKEFQQELQNKNADWELIQYGTAYHAFTNPNANDVNFGTVYHPNISNRAFVRLGSFIKECFEK